jgi:Na+-transporting NADH:ubiquinone oxidoreductase subunit C
LVNLEDGSYNTEMDAKKYKLLDAIQNGVKIENPKFNPGEQKRQKVSKVYFIKGRKGDEIENIVLPIYGKGLWGTLWGYLALESDLETIQGINFYNHKETPGLGGEVDNPSWKRQWEGKKLYDPQGEPAALVFKGSAPAGNPYAVDGLSGATITSRGVTNFVRYWASDDGFKPFLEKLKQEMKQPAATSSDKDQNNG